MVFTESLIKSLELGASQSQKKNENSCRLPLYIACFEADSVYGSHSIAVPRVLVFPYVASLGFQVEQKEFIMEGNW